MNSKLYLCATPIGNLGDVTRRVEKTLAEADLIYAEDTRRAGVLLNSLGLHKPLRSCHEHNENSRADEIAAAVRGGKAVAYITDAGMPGVSDPGERLIAAFMREGLPFEVLPGPSAFITAAVLSGLPCGEICFIGFLPREGKQRREKLKAYAEVPATMVIYESPLRAAATLEELSQRWGDRPAALVREITKLYEETTRGSLREIAERFRERPPRGECVLVVAGAKKPNGPSEQDMDAMLRALMAEGASLRDAAREAGAALGAPRNEAYRRAVELSRESVGEDSEE